MKRIISMLTIMLVILASCNTSKESKVQNAFEEYVNNNFDNPKDVKEIVSVELLKRENTDSLRSLIKEFTYVIDKQYQKDSILIKRYTDTKAIDKITRNMNRISSLSVHLYGVALKGWGNYLSNDYADYYSYRLYNNKVVANDSICEPFDLSVYKIKFRQKVGENLILREYYGIFDNLKEKDNITIQSENLKDEQYPKWFITCGTAGQEMNKIKDRFSAVREKIEKAFFDIKLELSDKGVNI